MLHGLAGGVYDASRQLDLPGLARPCGLRVVWSKDRSSPSLLRVSLQGAGALVMALVDQKVPV